VDIWEEGLGHHVCAFFGGGKLREGAEWFRAGRGNPSRAIRIAPPKRTSFARRFIRFFWLEGRGLLSITGIPPLGVRTRRRRLRYPVILERVPLRGWRRLSISRARMRDATPRLEKLEQLFDRLFDHRQNGQGGPRACDGVGMKKKATSYIPAALTTFSTLGAAGVLSFLGRRGPHRPGTDDRRGRGRARREFPEPFALSPPPAHLSGGNKFDQRSGGARLSAKNIFAGRLWPAFISWRDGHAGAVVFLHDQKTTDTASGGRFSDAGARTGRGDRSAMKSLPRRFFARGGRAVAHRAADAGCSPRFS